MFLSHPCLNEVILCLLQNKQEESHRTELCGGVIELVGVIVCCLVSTNFLTHTRAMLGTLLRKQGCMTEENVFVVEGYAYVLYSRNTIDPNKYNIYLYI